MDSWHFEGLGGDGRDERRMLVMMLKVCQYGLLERVAVCSNTLQDERIAGWCGPEQSCSDHRVFTSSYRRTTESHLYLFMSVCPLESIYLLSTSISYSQPCLARRCIPTSTHPTLALVRRLVLRGPFLNIAASEDLQHGAF